MSEKNEMIEDIVAEIRGTSILSIKFHNAENAHYLALLAQRIEEAWKLERDHLLNEIANAAAWILIERINGMNTNEKIVDIAAEIGEKSDFCHNNISTKTWEDWERMHEWLLNLRIRIEGFALRRAIELSKQFVPGNAAAMREALNEIREKCVIYNNALAEEIDAICGNAIAAPARNCDRFNTGEDAYNAFKCHRKNFKECAEKECGKCMIEWLYATAEAKGETNGSK